MDQFKYKRYEGPDDRDSSKSNRASADKHRRRSRSRSRNRSPNSKRKSDSPEVLPDLREKLGDKKKESSFGGGVCFNCNEKGHITNKCPKNSYVR